MVKSVVVGIWDLRRIWIQVAEIAVKRANSIAPIPQPTCPSGRGKLKMTRRVPDCASKGVNWSRTQGIAATVVGSFSMGRSLGLTRERVRSTALAVFAANGYGGTSMGDLASALGITKASVYNWTPSKEALLTEVVSPYVSALHDMLAGLNDEVTGDPFGLLRGFVNCLHEHREIVQYVYQDVSVLKGTEVGAELSRLGQTIVLALTGPISPADSEGLTAAMGSMALAFCAIDPLSPVLREVLLQAAVTGFSVLRAELAAALPTVR